MIACILRDEPSLALGNVVGSTIANILGAFSLGLLFHQGTIVFDKEAKLYTGMLLIFTSIFTLLAAVGHLDLTGGIFFLVGFGVYVVTVCWGIYEGFLTKPVDPELLEDEEAPSESAPLIPNGNGNSPPPTRPQHGALYYLVKVILGFIILSISGYLLAHASSSLAAAFNLSGTVLGMTLLSFATTLPEKFTASLSGMRGHEGIVIAGTTGSNIFLLTLCLGVLFVSNPAGNEALAASLVPFEVWSAWACSLLLIVIVFIGARPWMGGLLLGMYLAFIGMEFAVYRR